MRGSKVGTVQSKGRHKGIFPLCRAPHSNGTAIVICRNENGEKLNRDRKYEFCACDPRITIATGKKLVHSKSQEEAALVLQKHYRGYQIRSKNNSSTNDKLDSTACKLLKTMCNKWKGKSIYQVILLDRAKKLQDVVYFSLQLHMYNQHVICSLNNINRQPVLLGNIMSTTNITEFLGGKKCYSYKIPFRLCQMDMMTTDQNDLMDENMTSNFDDYNWDSPLTRFPEARTAYKILKHSFTVRDQGVQVEINEGIRLSNSNVNSIQPDQNQDYKRVHKKFEEKPKTQFVTDNRFNVNNEKKDPNKITITTKTKSFKPPDRANPVHELQLKAKQQLQLGQTDEDDPPYNFQAILKKTNYKRPSLEGRSVRYSSETSGLQQVDMTSRSKDYKNELNQQLSKATKTELLPGIMLEGSSYDL